MINRPCRQDRRSRLFNRKKLTQIIIRTCQEWGTYDVQAAIEDALAIGCEAEERKRRQQREADKAQELQRLLDAALKRLAAILAAFALLSCASDEDKQEAQEAQNELNNVLQPVTNGAVFQTGGGYGGAGFTTGGTLDGDALANLILQVCQEKGPAVTRAAILAAMAGCSEEPYPLACDVLEGAAAAMISVIAKIQPMLRFGDQILSLLNNLGLLSPEEYSAVAVATHSLASGEWIEPFEAVALALGCTEFPRPDPFTTGDGF